MMDGLDNFLGSLADKRIPGGCATCEAEQVLTERMPGVWLLTIAHEDGCQQLRSATGRARRN